MDKELIHRKIFEVRGCKVMLDFDLAQLYEVQTKNLNLAVKRNLKRFPEDFMFRLTTYEWQELRFQLEGIDYNDSLRLQFVTTALVLLANKSRVDVF